MGGTSVDLGPELLVDFRAAKTGDLAAQTLASYLSDLRRAFRFFQTREHVERIEDVTPRNVRHWLEWETAAGSSTSTRARRFYALSSLSAWAVDEEIIPRPFCRGVRAPRRDQRLPALMDDSAWTKFFELSRPSPQHHVAIAVLAFTGIRRAEALALNWADIDFQRRILFVRQGKGRKDRAVPLAPQLEEVLRRWRQTAVATSINEPDAVLLGRTGNRLSRDGLTRIIRRYAQVLGVDVTPHSFRHYLASQLIADGADIVTVKELLGHRDISTTSRYVHTTARRMRGAMDSWAATDSVHKLERTAGRVLRKAIAGSGGRLGKSPSFAGTQLSESTREALLTTRDPVGAPCHFLPLRCGCQRGAFPHGRVPDHSRGM